jgi:hypothetical protein
LPTGSDPVVDPGDDEQKLKQPVQLDLGFRGGNLFRPVMSLAEWDKYVSPNAGDSRWFQSRLPWHGASGAAAQAMWQGLAVDTYSPVIDAESDSRNLQKCVNRHDSGSDNTDNIKIDKPTLYFVSSPSMVGVHQDFDDTYILEIDSPSGNTDDDNKLEIRENAGALSVPMTGILKLMILVILQQLTNSNWQLNIILTSYNIARESESEMNLTMTEISV